MEHRRRFVNLKDFDYNTLYPSTLRILPPDSVMDLWRKDYAQMQLSMIYSESPSFEEITTCLTKLEDEVRKLNYEK